MPDDIHISRNCEGREIFDAGLPGRCTAPSHGRNRHESLYDRLPVLPGGVVVAGVTVVVLFVVLVVQQSSQS